MERTRQMPSFKPAPAALLALLLAAVAGSLFVASASRAVSEPETGPPRPVLTVTREQPQRSAMALQLAANGNVAAWQEASIGAESQGLRLTEVLVNVGDKVQAGQLLARFATDSVQADIALARASLLEAQAQAAEAQANAERARALQATGALSQQQIMQLTTADKTAQARVQSAQASLDVQLLRLRQTRVLAPDSGVISARAVTVGAVPGPGAELFRMLRKGRLEWRAEVTAAELHRIAPGTRVSVTGAGGSVVALQGRVRMLAPTVDPLTRNALVYVDLPAHPQLRAGMFARGEFALGSSEALTVPQQALVVRDGFSYVFVLGADQRVQQRKVQTGRHMADRVELLSGLAAQDFIVVHGAGFLNGGDLVRVVSPKEIKQETPVAWANRAPSATR